MRSRGINVEVPIGLGDLSRDGWGFEWSAAALAKPTSREASIEDIARALSQAHEDDTAFLMSARLQRDGGRGSASVSVRSADDFVEVHLASETWWKGGAVKTIDDASTIARRLVSFALKVSRWPTEVTLEVSLRELVAKVGDHKVHLGWESKAAPIGSASWRQWIELWSIEEHGATWPVLLLHGDPRVRLRVMPDGRSHLRVARTLLRRLGPG
ncbi:MAG: hypothetical protein HC888_11025 [Candidatus Competibacteraceae bacterium]|nr:hypothetical protein [Candidatus Competibacteraceae bacterium]